MGPHNVRAYLSKLFALFALIILSTLTIFSSFDSREGLASAAPARFALAGAMIAASPTNLTNCRQCMVTVINKSPNRNLIWFASNSGISGVTIKPIDGILQPKGKVSVNITMPSNTTCPANDTITFAGPMNSVNISWSCTVTPTLIPVTPTPTPTMVPTPSPTPSAIPMQTATSITPTTTSVPHGGGQQNNGNPPTSSDSPGSSVPSILFSVAALLLALFAFTLYVNPSAKTSLRNRLLSLILPVSFLKRLDQNH